MKTLLFSTLLLIVVVAGYAQIDGHAAGTSKTNCNCNCSGPSKANFGIGVGLGYGGFGTRMSVLPIQHVSLFGAVGFNFQTVAYNLGGTIRVLPKKTVTPTIIGMYGYNTLVMAKGLSRYYSKTFYGATFGAGIEYKPVKGPGFLNFEVLVPIRSNAYENYYNTVSKDETMQLKGIWPVTVAVGYHLLF